MIDSTQAITIFYWASALAVLLAGGGVGFAGFHLAKTLNRISDQLLPRLDETLVDLKQNLERLEELTNELNTTVGEANGAVQSASRTIHRVENGVVSFNQHVATPMAIAMTSLKVGAAAAWRAFRDRRLAKYNAAPHVAVSAYPEKNAEVETNAEVVVSPVNDPAPGATVHETAAP